MSEGLIRNVGDARLEPVRMDGADGASMALMVGRGDGAPNFSMRQFEVAAGGHTPRHSHDYEHEVYILGGSGTVLLNGREQPVRTGDALYVPADSEHQFQASGGEALKFLCFVPVTRNCGESTPGS